MRSDFYVYEHWRPDTDVCFYVGKGSGRRAWYLTARNPEHQSVVSQLLASGMAPDIRIVANNLTEAEAFAMETARIALYPLSDLVNMTEGGEGAQGWIPTPEYRAKMSSILAGRIPSAETRKKMSDGRMGMKFSEEHVANMSRANKGKRLSQEHRAKLSAAHRGKKKSPEHIEKLRLSFIGRKRSPETIAKWKETRRKNLLLKREAA